MTTHCECGTKFDDIVVFESLIYVYICMRSEHTTGCAAMIISREYRRRGETARRCGKGRQ